MGSIMLTFVVRLTTGTFKVSAGVSFKHYPFYFDKYCCAKECLLTFCSSSTHTEPRCYWRSYSKSDKYVGVTSLQYQHAAPAQSDLPSYLSFLFWMSQPVLPECQLSILCTPKLGAITKLQSQATTLLRVSLHWEVTLAAYFLKEAGILDNRWELCP